MVQLTDLHIPQTDITPIDFLIWGMSREMFTQSRFKALRSLVKYEGLLEGSINVANAQKHMA